MDKKEIKSDRYKKIRKEAETWANQKIAQMTLEEKMRQLSSFFPNGNSRLGIPHMQQGECLHGVVADLATSFPQALALGSTWNPDLIEEVATVIAKEARALGIHQCYSPMVAISRDPRWGRIQESYGEDPHHVAEIGVAYAKGLQGTGEEYLDQNHIIATAKHYVADGEPLGGLNGAAMEISLRSLHEVHLLPFERMVKEANVASIMPAHHSLNGIPCHSNHYLLQDVLRDMYGFDGIVVSDNGDIRKLHTDLYVSDDPRDSAAMAIEAGVDTELAWMMPWGESRMYGPVLQEAVEKGKVDISKVDQAVRRVLIKKYQMDLMSDPTADPNQETLENIYADAKTEEHISMAGKALYYGKSRDDKEEILYDESHNKLALDTALESLILLENKKNLLPLKAEDIKNMAIIGPNATRLLLGNYSTLNPRYYVSVLDGIEKVAKDKFQIDYYPALDPDHYMAEDIDKAVEGAKKADVTLLVLGGNEITCMENQDTDDLNLKGDQEELLKRVARVSKNLILLLLDGRPSSINFAKENVDNILLGFFLGQETGNAVARILFGQTSPSGKLPLTIPRNVGQVQCHYNRFHPGRRPSYYRSPVSPLYHFGYGMSYSSFEISEPITSKDTFKIDEEVEIQVNIKNTGTMQARETVQLYIKDVIASRVRPIKELKKFEKVNLKAQEEKTISFKLNKRDFAFWKDDGWVTEAGEFIIMVGADSENLKERQIWLEE